MFKLRDYQEEAVKHMLDTKPGEPTLISIPTGTGKTVCFASVVNQAAGRVLIVVPSDELREQSIDKIKVFDPDIDVGSVQGVLDDVQSRIIVATRQSLTSKKSKRIKRMLEHGSFEYVIFDEAHQAISQIETIVKKLNSNCKVCGLTATPWNKDMNKVFKKITYGKTLLNMIMDGYLCEPLAIRVYTDTDLTHVKTVAGEFNQAQLESAVNTITRNQDIIRAYEEHALDRKSVLIFATSIDHVQALVSEFKNAGYYCRGLDSMNTSKDERKAIIDEFKSGKLPILINCGILTTGFDYERLDCIVLARPTKSKILYTQVIGRGLRLHPEKDNCMIIDVVDIVKKHDLISLDDALELKVKHKEGIKEAVERNEREKIEREEQERVHEEYIREAKLRSERISLFNKNLQQIVNQGRYDWFRLNDLAYCVSTSTNEHMVISMQGNKYILLAVNTNNDIRKAIDIIEGESLNEILESAEIGLKKIKGSYHIKKVPWKKEAATEKQRLYVENAKTKWDAHKHFASYNILKVCKANGYTV